MMSPLEGGDAWPGDAAASASAAEGYSAPIRVIGIISATAHSLGAGRRGKPNARPAGSLVRRTTTTSAAPFTSTRNRAWRARHPGYWRKSPHPRNAHKDVLTTQALGSIGKTSIFARSPL